MSDDIPEPGQHRTLIPPERPLPDVRDVVRVAVDEEGREIEVQPA